MMPHSGYGGAVDPARPDSVRDVSTRLRAFAWPVALAWAAFAVINGLQFRLMSVGLDLTVTAITLAVILQADRMTRIGPHLVLGASLVGATGAALLTGQGSAAIAWWLIPLPLVAAFLTPGRASSGWTAASLICLLGVHASQVFWPLDPEYTSHRFEILLLQVLMVLALYTVATSAQVARQGRLAGILANEEAARSAAEALALSNAELAKARKKAEEEAKSRADFAAAVSHEIRTPLNGILGMAQLLRDETDPSRARDYTDELLRSGQTLLRLVNNVLDYSRAGEGKLDMPRDAFDLHAVIDDAVQLYASQAWALGLDLAYIPGDGVTGRAVGDGAAIQQVVANLVGNAMRYTRHGAVEVRTRLEGSEHVAIVVADTGIGIPEDRLETIWNPWVRGEGMKVGGTGLGLALVKRMTEALGGYVTVTSKVGQGSAFTMIIPMAMGAATDPPEGLPRAVVVSVESPTSARAIVARCRMWGLEVHAMADARRVPDLLKKHAVDAVICDAPWARPISELPEAPPVLPVHSGSDSYGTGGGGTQLMIPVGTDALLAALRRVGEPDGARFTDVAFDSRLAERFPHRILIAEDNPTNQRVITLMLGRMGYTPRLVGNGAEAVDAAVQGEFDLILMDRSMPVMDGIEASKRILTLKPGSRIVLVSAGYDSLQREDLIRIGVTEFLDKPVPLESLREVLTGGVELQGEDGQPTANESVEGTGPVLQYLLDINEGDWEGVEELLTLWSQTSDQQIRDMKQAIADGNAVQLERAAHGLKGSAAAYQVKGVAGQAAEVERRAQSGEPVDQIAEAVVVLGDSARYAARELLREVRRSRR